MWPASYSSGSRTSISAAPESISSAARLGSIWSSSLTAAILVVVAARHQGDAARDKQGEQRPFERLGGEAPAQPGKHEREPEAGDDQLVYRRRQVEEPE